MARVSPAMKNDPVMTIKSSPRADSEIRVHASCGVAATETFMVGVISAASPASSSGPAARGLFR
jgi:hypothetical protein